MTSQRYLYLGLFFVVVFGVLGWFTLFKSNFSLFKDHTRLSVYFDGAGGLRPGDSVLVAGMRWGKVQALTLDTTAERDRRVIVELDLEQPLVLYRDSKIEIEDATVLGGKTLSIEPGRASSGQIPPDEPLFGAVALNVMDSLADVIRENRDSLASTLRNLEKVVGDLQKGDGTISRLIYDQDLAGNLSKSIESISATFENARELTDALTATEQRGTLGKLIYEDAVYNDLLSIEEDARAFLTDARETLRLAREGDGTLGMLVSDKEVADRFREMTDRLASIVRRLDDGEGTLGKLLSDPATAERIDGLVTDLAEGRGTLGKLWKDEAVYEDVQRITGNLADASTALAEGRGTLGRLLNDDELYLQLERAVRTLVGSLEEAREAAPISTFLNTLFLGF